MHTHSHADLHRCSYPGCHAWAHYRHDRCTVHAGLDVEIEDPLAAWPASVEVERTRIDPVLALRDNLLRYLTLYGGFHPPRLAEDLRALRSLALTTRRLTPAGGSEGAASARDEIEAFLATVSREIFEEAGWDPVT